MSKIFSAFMIICLLVTISGCQESVVNDDLEGIGGELVGTLDGYDFYRESFSCAMYVVNITVDGYNFGTFPMACGDSLDDIGYIIKKDGVTYSLQDLVDDNILKTKDIYYKIYKPDPFRKGI